MTKPLSFLVFSSKEGYRSVDLKAQVTAPTRDALLRELVRAIAENNVSPEKCVGLVGWQSSDQLFFGVEWRHEPMLRHASLAVIYHPDAVIPPAFVLDRAGVVYGMVGAATAS